MKTTITRFCTLFLALVAFSIDVWGQAENQPCATAFPTSDVIKDTTLHWCTTGNASYKSKWTYLGDNYSTNYALTTAGVWCINGNGLTDDGNGIENGKAVQVTVTYGAHSWSRLDTVVCVTADEGFTWITAQNHSFSSGSEQWITKLVNASSCDSNVQYTVHFREPSNCRKSTTVENCVSYKWTWDNITYTESGVYPKTFAKGTAGKTCNLSVSLGQNSTFEKSTDGSVFVTYKAAVATTCDSSDTLHLTIHKGATYNSVH